MPFGQTSVSLFQPDGEDRPDQPGVGGKPLYAGRDAAQSQLVQRIGDDAGVEFPEAVTVFHWCRYYYFGATAFRPSTMTSPASTSTMFLPDSTTTAFFSGSEK